MSEDRVPSKVHGQVGPGMRPNPVGGLGIRPEPWMADGLCSQTDPEAFFVEKGGTTKPAKAVCVGCPVRLPCLVYALEKDERFGVWGGYSERERRRLKRGEVVTLIEPKRDPEDPKLPTCGDCGGEFLPGHPHQIYCCRGCKSRAGQRRYNEKRRKNRPNKEAA